MICNLENNDIEAIVNIIKQDFSISDSEVKMQLLNKYANTIVFKDGDSNILGFACIRLWNKEKRYGELSMFVAPISRRKGIGTNLYRAISELKAMKELSRINTYIKSNVNNSIDFFKKIGYNSWYTELILSYQGANIENPNLNMVPYEDKYFELYTNGLRDSFYNLRKSNDFEPYYCCELTEDKRKEFLGFGDIFMMFEDDSFIGSVRVTKSGDIDDLYVLPENQGHDYGRKLMQFAINKAQELNYTNIQLSAIEWNKRALNLYKSLGFRVTQSTYHYRLFQNN